MRPADRENRCAGNGGRSLCTFFGLAVAAYALLMRPRLLRWGATDEEVKQPYPGAGLIPSGTRGATMAVTIEAPPASVWPWLVQMGYDRAGYYSWDRLDNLGRPSADRIHPEWQQISLGDRLTAMGRDAGWTVAALEPARFLGLRASYDLSGREFDPAGPRPRFYTDSLWGFLLKELPGGRTRLIVSGSWAFRPRWLQPIASFLFLEPAHWIMQMRQFANLKRYAERDRRRNIHGGDAPEQPPAVREAGSARFQTEAAPAGKGIGEANASPMPCCDFNAPQAVLAGTSSDTRALDGDYPGIELRKTRSDHRNDFE